MRIERLSENPIIRPELSETIGANINGPSLIRVPEWIDGAMAKYYLYFAHHKGKFIRLAYADELSGPWRIHEPGTLHLDETPFVSHIASPDVHVVEELRQVRMYFHGSTPGDGQLTRVAVSRDGLAFECLPEILGTFYFRVWRWKGEWYAIDKHGQAYRSRDGLTGFVRGPRLFDDHMRHSALKLDGGTLTVFYSNMHDCPERIMVATVELAGDWMEWRNSEPVTLLEAEREWEGADLPLVASVEGWAPEPVRQLRDPCVYRDAETGRDYLLYSVAGEQGIAIGEIAEAGAPPPA